MMIGVRIDPGLQRVAAEFFPSFAYVPSEKYESRGAYLVYTAVEWREKVLVRLNYNGRGRSPHKLTMYVIDPETSRVHTIGALQCTLTKLAGRTRALGKLTDLLRTANTRLQDLESSHQQAENGRAAQSTLASLLGLEDSVEHWHSGRRLTVQRYRAEEDLQVYEAEVNHNGTSVSFKLMCRPELAKAIAELLRGNEE